MRWPRVKRLVEALVLEHLDADEAEARRQAALERRGVWVDDSREGTCHLAAVLDAPDAIHLDATLDRLARILADGGVRGTEQARRAQALGVLATPARALQLLQASLLDELPTTAENLAELCHRDGQPGHTCGAVTVDPEKLLPPVQVELHLTDQTLTAGSGLVRSRRIGAVLAEWLPQLFGHHRIQVRPVIDTPGMAPSDSYEVPPTMREAVELRNPHEVFPWSTRASGGLDLDHTIPWRPPATDASSPPLTRPDNLGPLTRRVHRAKTHGGWQVAQPLPGIFCWQSPHGHRWLVTPSRTIALGRAPTPGHQTATTAAAA